MKTTTALTVLSLALAAPVVGAPMGPGSTMQGPMMQGQMMHGMCGMGTHVEGSLAYLKTELKITASQMSAWDGFAVAYREAKGQGGQMEMMMPQGMMTGHKNVQPLPERMAHHRAMMEAHLAQMAKLQPAVVKLYGALEPEQKRTADDIMPMFLMCRVM